MRLALPAALAGLWAAAGVGTAASQDRLAVEIEGGPPPGAALVLPVDADDDDEDGQRDATQGRAVPGDDLRVLTIRATGTASVRAVGGVRLVYDGQPVVTELSLRAGRATHVAVQGVRASGAPGDAALVVTQARGGEQRIPITVVGLALLDAENTPMDATRSALRVSHRVTNDASLPRAFAWASTSQDPTSLRLEVFDPAVRGDELQAHLESVDPGTGRVRGTRTLTLRRDRSGRPLRSPFVRLVGDEMDATAPGVGDRLLLVALRDDVRLRYDTPSGPVYQSVRVGRPGDEEGPLAARRASLRIRVLRAGGMPAVGGDDSGALRIARTQVRIANEIWLQCLMDFGDPEEADVAAVDPPPPSLLAVADRDGLPARGGGEIRFRAGGRVIGPVATRAGAPPVATALDVARALRTAGLRPQVTENAPTELGAGRSADVVVRDAGGALVRLESDGTAPLGTDPRQSVQIGVVDLADGLQEFDNMTAAAGTLEERAMIKALGDGDPSTIDIFVVNRFTAGTRQGEAFIESDGGSVINTLILDRNGIRQQREAWTQSHEVGHVLLDHPFHPDNVGPDRPWLLMDADSSLGLVTGPKRLTDAECRRVRHRSGVHAAPALLRRVDARPSTPIPGPDFDPGYPRD